LESQPTRIQEVAAPRPQTVDFNELDNLMAELGGGGAPKPVAQAPAPVQAAPKQTYAPAPVQEPVYAPAPVQAAPVQAAAPSQPKSEKTLFIDFSSRGSNR